MKIEKKVLATTVMISAMAMSGLTLAGQGDGSGDSAGTGDKVEGKPKHHHRDRHHGSMMGGKRDGGKGFERMVQKLDLSEEQQQHIKDVRKASREEAKPLRKQLKENMHAEREAMEASASETELKKLARNTADSRVDLMLYGRKTEDKVREILTPEQIAQLDQLKAERKERRAEKNKKWQEKRAKREQGDQS